MAVQGDKVKKGQAVAYIEQLGTFVPVEVRALVPVDLCFTCCFTQAANLCIAVVAVASAYWFPVCMSCSVKVSNLGHVMRKLLGKDVTQLCAMSTAVPTSW